MIQAGQVGQAGEKPPTFTYIDIPNPLPDLPDLAGYRVLVGETVPELMYLVNRYVSEKDYQPIGGIATAVEGLKTLYLQAVVRTGQEG